MLFKSEITGKEYKTMNECLVDEEQVLKKKEEKFDDDTFSVVDENGKDVTNEKDEEILRKEIEEQDKVVKDCFEVCKETINKVNYDISLAYKNAKQKKQDAYDLVMKQTNILQDKLVEYNKKYGAFKWADGTIEKIGIFPTFEGKNLLNKLLRDIFGI